MFDLCSPVWLSVGGVILVIWSCPPEHRNDCRLVLACDLREREREKKGEREKGRES